MTAPGAGGGWVIWHNPRCSTSRFVLQALRDGGVEPVVRDYQKDPPSAAELRAASVAARLDAGVLLRQKDASTAGAGNDDPIAMMAADPALIQRPLVFLPDGSAVMCRPKEMVFELLKKGR